MIPILNRMVEEDVSDTRFKLEEASYFFEQMKKNLDNRKYFMFNLIAFVSAARSVTYVMQEQYKNDEDDPFWKWYVPYVQEALKKEEVPAFFCDLRVKFVHVEGNPRQYLFTTVSKRLRSRYHIIGAANEKKEELIEHNSKRESKQEQETTITDNPAAPDPTQKYVWYIPDINDKTKKSRRYVIESCEQYLQRLSGLADECERLFG
jgi:hypothetical protein